jgi:hypothetical protein
LPKSRRIGEPMSDDDNNDLAIAEHHVAQAQLIVARQRARIVRLEAAGAGTLDARQTLEVFETNLRIFEGHRDYLRSQRDRRGRTPEEQREP